MAGAHDAERVAVVDERAQGLPQPVARAPGVAGLEMEVVDDDQKDSASGVVRRPPLRQDDSRLGGRRRWCQKIVDALSMRQHERDDRLFHTVFVDLHLAGLEVGDELTRSGSRARSCRSSPGRPTPRKVGVV